jgi:hypothetical protein
VAFVAALLTVSEAAFPAESRAEFRVASPEASTAVLREAWPERSAIKPPEESAAASPEASRNETDRCFD